MKLRTDSLFLTSTIDQVERDYSPIILICGKQRRGKSNIGLAVGNIFMQYFHNKPFDPEKNLFFDPVDMIEKMDKSFREPLIIDEAGVLFNSQEFYSHLNIALNKIIQSQAYLNNIYIMILPMARDLAKRHRHYINFRLNMIKRGVARVHKLNIKYEDMFEERTHKKAKYVFLEHFEYKFFQGPVWDKYTELANGKKKEIREQLRDYLIAEKQRRIWICKTCGHENIVGMKRCTNCKIERGIYGS